MGAAIDAEARTLEPLLDVEELTKAYPGLIACDRISLSISPGEVIAVVGENGAGKSTLVKMLYGLTEPAGGKVRFEGREIVCDSPRTATSLGIGMVSQEFMLVDALTVAENIALSVRQGQRRGPMLDLDAIRRQVAELSARYGMPIDPDALVEDLPIGLKQRVEIVKALIQGAKLLILDEPTAVLTPDEADDLLDAIRRFRSDGKAVLLITHKLREVVEVADKVTVLRRGRVVATLEGETTIAHLGHHMVGEAVEFTYERDPVKAGAAALVLDGVSVKDPAGGGLNELSLELMAGEILGIAGVEGNGQTALAEVICGLIHPARGRVVVLGEELRGQTPGDLFEAGVSYIPADRNAVGSVPDFSIAENLILKSFRSPPASRRGMLDRRAVAALGRELIDVYDIRAAGPDAIAGSLSGGNLQKVILAREIGNADPRLVVAAHPTRGLDIRAARYVHERLLERRAKGTAVLLISADLDEVLALSDRVAVIGGGTILDVREAGSVDHDWLAPLMGGSRG